jgi:hypothetical protein
VRRRPIGGAVAIAAVTLLLGGGCVGGSSGASCAASDIPEHDSRTIVIEGDPWSGYAPFRDAELLLGTPFRSQYVAQL